MSYTPFNPFVPQYPPYYTQPSMPVQGSQAGTQLAMPQQVLMPAQMPGPQQPVANTAQTQGISPASRPVGNREEANAVPADFSGAPMVFPDLAHGRVYVKRWNIEEASPEFEEYALAVPQEAQKPAAEAEFVGMEAFRALAERVEALENRKRPVKKTGREGNDDE